MAVLPLLGKVLAFPLKHWFLTSAAVGTIDYLQNDSKLMKSGMEKAGDFIADASQQGFSSAFDNLDRKIGQHVDEFLGPDSTLGAFVKGHWGKLAGGTLSLGLLASDSGWAKMLGVVGAGAVAYSAYQHVTQNGFNASASGQGAPAADSRPIVNLDSLKQKANELIGTGTNFVAPLLGNTNTTQPEPKQ